MTHATTGCSAAQRWLIAVIALAVLAVPMIVVRAPVASAMPACATATPIITNASELDDAITCYNAQTPAGSHTITFDRLLTHPSGTPAITQANTDFELTIKGTIFTQLVGPGAVPGEVINLFTVSGPANVTFDGARLFSADASNVLVEADAGEVTFIDTVIGQARGDGAPGDGVRVLGGTVSITSSILNNNKNSAVSVQSAAASLTIEDSWLARNDESALAVVDGAASISNSFVDDNDVDAVVVSGGTLEIAESTISRTAGEALRVTAGVVTLSNSTVVDNVSGVNVEGGVAAVSNATVANNETTGLKVADGLTDALQVESSIVIGNGPSDCAGSLTDAGKNFDSDSSCVDFSTFTGALGVLSNNGCGAPAPTDCVLSVALESGSNAMDSGNCVEVVTGIDSAAGTFIKGDLTTDQRGAGYDRTIGADCDAGAFEATPDCTTSTAPVTVTNAPELDQAIRCYNAQLPPGSRTIVFGNDFSHPTGTPPITQADPAFALTIEGTEKTLTGNGLPASTTDLFTVSGAGPVKFADLTLLNAGRNAVATTGAAREVSIVSSTISDGGVAVIIAGSSLAFSISNSNISDNGGGVYLANGTASISQSTISNNSGDGVFISAGSSASSMVIESSTINGNARGVRADTGGVLISNSTIANNVRGIVVGNDRGDTIIANSTIAYNQYGLEGFSGTVASVWSSIIAANSTSDCGAPLLILDLDSNFASDGTCAGFTSTPATSLDALADNGGPTQTVALRATSTAINGGTCTGVFVGLGVTGDLTNDQRGPGFPRTLGVECDAGAYEGTFFSDVVPTAFYAEAVGWAVDNDITTGTGDGTTFSPNGIVTRAQIATFLWRAADEPEPSGANPFSDVPTGKFFTDAVVWLAETGITTGTGDGTTFSPQAPVNRAQMATFLWRLAGEPAPRGTNPFSDVPADKFFTDAVVWLAETGITTGTGDGTTFSPAAALTRAQAVTFLFRSASLPA